MAMDDDGFIIYNTTSDDPYRKALMENERLRIEMENLTRRNYTLRHLWATDMGYESFEDMIRHKGDRIIHIGRYTHVCCYADTRLPNAGSQQYIKLSDL